MALLRSRQHSPLKTGGAVNGQEACSKQVMVMAGASPQVDEQVVVSSGELLVRR